MKALLRCFAFFTLLGAARPVQAACSITSTDGYTVHISIAPASIVPSTTDCPWGYNYNVTLNYSITFTGPHAPSAMYTLQGNVVCGSQSLFFDLPNSPASGTTTTTSNAYVNHAGSAYTYPPGVPNCTSANTNNLHCNTVLIEIHGPGIPSQIVNCNFSSSLPIELTSFTGRRLPAGVELSWTSASETNNDYYTLEKSADGIVFEKLAEVKGAGNSSKASSYTYTDSQPFAGTTYYRLRQTDYDGLFEYFDMIAVEHTGQAGEPLVYPNPAGDQSVFITAPAQGEISITIFDLAGQQVKETLVLQGEANAAYAILEPGVLLGGAYVLRIHAGNKIYLKKLVI